MALQEIFPEDLFAVYRLRSGDLFKRLNDPRIKIHRVLDAMAVGMGYADGLQLRGHLEQLTGADMRDLDRDEGSMVDEADLRRLQGLIALQKDMSDPESRPFHDWVLMEESLRLVANELDVEEERVLDIAARTWCDANNWDEVMLRAKSPAAWKAQATAEVGVESGFVPAHLGARRNRLRASARPAR